MLCDLVVRHCCAPVLCCICWWRGLRRGPRKSQDIAVQIVDQGFDHRRARENGLYGRGTYFAAESCKSRQYTCPSDCGMHACFCEGTLGMSSWPALPWGLPSSARRHARRCPVHPRGGISAATSIFQCWQTKGEFVGRKDEFVVLDMAISGCHGLGRLRH